MIRAWCAHGEQRAAWPALGTLLPSGASVVVDPATGLESVMVATAPAEATAAGHGVGRAPLPWVSVERGAHGTLVVERGGFGGRPAWVRCERDVALASTDLGWVVDASRALGLAVTVDPDQLAAQCLLDAGAIGRSRSLFREVKEVPPGTRARLLPGELTFERLAPPRAPEEAGACAADARRVVEHLRERLGVAVERALEGASRAFVLTGGGLDSGALLAMAHARTARTLAFAISFEGEGDDRPHLAALARALGLAPVRITPDEAELPGDLTTAGLPLTWPSGAAEALALRRARAHGASRVLAGLGADELFDGDLEATSLRSRLRAGVPWMLRCLARRRSRARAPAWAGPRAQRVVRAAHERALAERPWSERSLEERLHASFVDPHFAHASTLRLQLEQLSGTLRIDPYLDGDLAAFALALPPRALLGTGTHHERRGLFREALRGMVPEPLRTRQDKASFEPLHRGLFRPPHLATLEAYADVARLADLGIVEPVAFRRAFDAAAVTREGFVDARLYATLAVEAFLRR